MSTVFPSQEQAWKGVADTGCTTWCNGPDIYRNWGSKRRSLSSLDVSLCVADGRRLNHPLTSTVHEGHFCHSPAKKCCGSGNLLVCLHAIQKFPLRVRCQPLGQLCGLATWEHSQRGGCEICKEAAEAKHHRQGCLEHSGDHQGPSGVQKHATQGHRSISC